MWKWLKRTSSCGSCGGGCAAEAARPEDVGRLEEGRQDYVVALAGNPNTGKSTVFNALTGLKQHTGNWPGKTVTRAEGVFRARGLSYRLVDLPGTYSLLSASVDEEIARDFILFGRPDCTVVVVDATALERNLNLVLQVLELSARVVVCVNLMDEARRKGIEVDLEALGERLGVPVVGTAARRGEGLERLVDAVEGVVTGRTATSPLRPPLPGELQRAIDEMVPLIQRQAPHLDNPRWVAFRLIEGDARMREALARGELDGLSRPRRTERLRLPVMALAGNQ